MIDKDIEIGKIVINSEKSHVGAGRAPIRHEQPLNSGAAEGGNETMPGGKVGDNGSMQRERRAQESGDAALDRGKVTQPDRLQLKRSLAWRGAFRFWRGVVAASPSDPRNCAVMDAAVSTADAAASAGQNNAA